MKKVMFAFGLTLMALAPTLAFGAARVIVGRPFFGGVYAPYWGPGYGYYGYYGYPNSGELKLDTKVKDAQVFINGAYAGTTHENKTMHLRPGSYDIEIRAAGQTQFAEKVYVAAGKTLHLHSGL